MPRYRIFHRNAKGTLFIKPTGHVSGQQSDDLKLGGEIEISPARQKAPAIPPGQSAEENEHAAQAQATVPQVHGNVLPLSEEHIARLAQSRLDDFLKLEKLARKQGVKFDGLAAFKSGVAIGTARAKIMNELADEDERTNICNVGGFPTVAESVAAERGNASGWERTIRDAYSRRGLEAPKPGQKVTARQLMTRAVAGAAQLVKTNTNPKE